LFDDSPEGVRKALLADFGLAKRTVTAPATQPLDHTFVGSPAYSSTEVLKRRKYNHLADLYSMGLVLWVMCSDENVSPEEMTALELGDYGGVKFQPLMYSGALKLLQDTMILARDIEKRQEATQVVRHEWLVPRLQDE
jgi:serine/threonine protein kinase